MGEGRSGVMIVHAEVTVRKTVQMTLDDVPVVESE